MKSLKVKFIFFSLLAIIAISFFMVSCEQDTIETIGTEHQEFKAKESYTIYAPKDAFSVEDFLSLKDATVRQNFADAINSKYASETEIEIESRHCTDWVWRPGGYECEESGWRACCSSAYGNCKFYFDSAAPECCRIGPPRWGGYTSCN